MLRSLKAVVTGLIRHALPAPLLSLALLLFARPEMPLLSAYGYARSLKLRRPIDEKGEPLPWLPYCLIAILKERLRPDFRVLEFGSGYSTLFFMTRVATVVSIEHDPTWADMLRRRISANVQIVGASAESPEAYCAHIAETTNSYDVILVDGLHRSECIKRALACISAQGVFILDDSDRPEYQDAVANLKQVGFQALHLQGHKPTTTGLHWATIFYRQHNCLGIY